MSTEKARRQISLTPLQMVLRETMEVWGCPLCHLSQQAEETFVRSLSYERVLDLKTRAVLQSSHGLCAAHSRMWLHIKGGSLGVAIVYRDVLRHLIEAGESATEPARGFRRRRSSLDGFAAYLSPEEPCPACEIGAATVERFGRLLLEDIEDPDLQALLVSCGGLCVPHLQVVLNNCKATAKARASLVGVQLVAWQQLLLDLDEFIRKNDYRFCDEVLTEGEGTAWRRVIHVLVGLKK